MVSERVRARRAVAITGLVASVFVSVPASAMPQQPAPAAEEPSAADKETARSLMDQGVEREEAKDYAGALKAYQGAHALVNFPMTGLAVARAQAGLGMLLEALETATQVKHMPPRPNETPSYARARAEADALAQKLSPRIPSVQVTVEGPKEKINVSIDGALIPPAAAALPHKVNPGKHVIVAASTGFEPATLEVMVPEGKTLPVSLTLQPRAVSASEGGGQGDVGAGVAPGGGDKGGFLGSLSPLVFVGFGVGAAGLIAGTVTGIVSLSKTSSLKEICGKKGPCPADQADAIKSANTIANVSNISFAVGAAGVAVGVVGIFLSGGEKKPAAPPATGLRVTPVVGLGSVGVYGTF